MTLLLFLIAVVLVFFLGRYTQDMGMSLLGVLLAGLGFYLVFVFHNTGVLSWAAFIIGLILCVYTIRQHIGMAPAPQRR